MARPPLPGGPPGGAPDPTAMAALAGGGATPPGADPGDDQDQGAGGTIVCTIARLDDGSYLVFAGDEPDDDSEMGGAGESDDDLGAMAGAGGPGGGAPGGPPGAAGGALGGSGDEGQDGQPAASIGEALKLAMDILRQDEQENPPAAGGAGSEGQFMSGFGTPPTPTPASGAPMGRKGAMA